MKNSWKEVIKSIKNDLDRYNIGTVFGISLGTSLALYSANSSKNIRKVILSLPFHSLASVLWNSPVTRTIVKKAKKKRYSMKDFHKILNPFDPVNNINKLKGKDVRVFIAKGDSIIPYEYAKILIKKMYSIDLIVRIKEVAFLGHFLGGLQSIFFPGWFTKKP
tara:strand:+ start:6479 stop:6967 length:489 start_codon:yes stop_codon:yes gene_type:complete